MKIHRYRLRPGITDIPTQLPLHKTEELSIDGDITVSVETLSRREDIDIHSDTFDLDYFIVLDEDFGQPYIPFYDWVNASKKIRGKYQANIVEKYNEIMDNITWLVRAEDLEVECEYIEDTEESTPQMTLYELNQQAYDNIAPKNEDEIEQVKLDLLNFILLHLDGKYAMLLCKELSDYTVFHKDSLISHQQSVETILQLLKTRGPILDLHYNKDGEYMECWVRYRKDSSPHMYVLFNCQDFVIEY